MILNRTCEILALWVALWGAQRKKHTGVRWRLILTGRVLAKSIDASTRNSIMRCLMKEAHGGREIDNLTMSQTIFGNVFGHATLPQRD